MNEIEKMYRNARIKKIELDYPDNFEPFYPEFTAEKQLELIKWISHHDGCFKVYLNSVEFGVSGFGSRSTFEESLAKAVSMYLSSATDKEKQQIKEILERE